MSFAEVPGRNHVVFLSGARERPGNGHCCRARRHQTLLRSGALWADSWVLTPVCPPGLFTAQCTRVVLTSLRAALDCAEKHFLQPLQQGPGFRLPSFVPLLLLQLPSGEQRGRRRRRAARAGTSPAPRRTRRATLGGRSLRSWARTQREQGPCAAWRQRGVCPREGTVGGSAAPTGTSRGGRERPRYGSAWGRLQQTLRQRRALTPSVRAVLPAGGGGPAPGLSELPRTPGPGLEPRRGVS